MAEICTVTYERSDRTADFPITFRDANSLLYKIEMNEDVRKKYEPQVDEDILEANPAWVLELFACAAAGNVCVDFYKKLGRVGVFNRHPGVSPEERERTSYKMYVDIQPELLEHFDQEKIRMALAAEISRLTSVYDDIIQLANDYNKASYDIERLKTNVMFGLDIK